MKKRIGMLVCSVLFFSLTVDGLAAETKKVAETGLGFTYENVMPDNQQREASFFDLKVKGGDKQTLKTKITNTTKEPITVMVTIGNAGTTTDGTIDYLSQEKLPGKVYLTDITTAPKEINLKAFEEKTLEIKLEIPTDGVPGTIMGGVDLAKKIADKKENTGSGVDNKYSYLYSITLTGEEVDEKVVLDSDESSYDRSLRTLMTSIVNPTNNLVKELKIEQIITPKDSKKVLTTAITEDLKIAPTSSFSYIQKGVNLDPGEYLVHTTAMVGKDKWEWEQPLTVAEETTTTVETPLEVETISNSFKLPLIILIGSIILITLILFTVIKLILNYRQSRKK